jgi:hypothetical protein
MPPKKPVEPRGEAAESDLLLASSEWIRYDSTINDFSSSPMLGSAAAIERRMQVLQQSSFARAIATSMWYALMYLMNVGYGSNLFSPICLLYFSCNLLRSDERNVIIGSNILLLRYV